MGRFRWFLPVTAFACVFAWLAIAGIPPFSGFWSKDEILVNAFDTDNYAVWIIGTHRRGLHRALHDAADLHDVLRQRALRRARSTPSRRVPVVSGGSDDGDAARCAPPTADADGRRRRRRRRASSRPCSSASRRDESRLHGHDPHESPIIMLIPLVALVDPRRRSAACSTSRSATSTSSAGSSSRCSAACTEPDPVDGRAGQRRRRLGAVRAAPVSPSDTSSTAAACARRPRTRSPRSSGPSASCSATPTTTTRASAGSSADPGSAWRRGSTGSSTRRSSTARSTASPSCSACSARA